MRLAPSGTQAAYGFPHGRNDVFARCMVGRQKQFDRLLAFGHALPQIRQRADEDLRRHGLPREKVLAAIVQLLDKTLIRVGNREYAATNKSFGLTTLRDRHVAISGDTVRFKFRAKSGIE